MCVEDPFLQIWTHAVTCNGGPNRRTRSSFIDTSNSSDDDQDRSRDDPINKKRRCEDKILQRLDDEVASIRDILEDMMSLTPDTHILMGLQRVLRDTFKCQICHSVPVRPPVIVTKCCRNILGCQVCVDTWYSGPEAMTMTCPMCCAEWGCNETMVLRGLTDCWNNSRPCTRGTEQMRTKVF